MFYTNDKVGNYVYDIKYSCETETVINISLVCTCMLIFFHQNVY